MRLLLVEDDPLLGDGLKVGLAQAGFQVDWVQDGMTAMHAVASESYAAMILDIALPRLGGFDVLQRMRTRGLRVPVLILTARDALDDRVRGLDGGADDYVVKPVDLHELEGRGRADASHRGRGAGSGRAPRAVRRQAGRAEAPRIRAAA